MTSSVRLAAAALAVAAASSAAPAAPAGAAAAAPCVGDGGVTVVVDFNSLGGGVPQVCVAGGGGTAASLFAAAGFDLTYASRQPGFVCRVNGVPASDPCVNTSPADAFWSLWWSDGDASAWSYSSVSAGSLSIPDGGMVAFSWDDVSGTAPPSASPSHPDAPSTPDPTQPAPDQPDPDDESPQAPGGGTTSAPGATGPGASPSASPAAPDEGDKQQKRKKRKRDRQAEPTDGATTTAPDVATPTDTGDEGSVTDPDPGSDGLPGWVAPGLIGTLFAVAGVVLLVRRRRSET